MIKEPSNYSLKVLIILLTDLNVKIELLIDLILLNLLTDFGIFKSIQTSIYKLSFDT